MTETRAAPTDRSEDCVQYDRSNEMEMDAEPSHHARRPMNAFLIFCKRHRSVVRDKYPNHENRQITKILGEWWANLDKDEKASYTGLAKQYKDAFFDAHPDFKWYKLPAPTKRTFGTRPANNTNVSTYSEFDSYPNTESSEGRVKQTNNNHLIKVNYNNVQSSSANKPGEELSPAFTPGKLADETQMGGLSSLIVCKNSENNLDLTKDNADSERVDISLKSNKDQVQKFSNQNKATASPLKKRPFIEINEDRKRVYSCSYSEEQLQDELSKTSRILELSFDDHKNHSFDSFSNSESQNEERDFEKSNPETNKLHEMKKGRIELDSNSPIKAEPNDGLIFIKNNNSISNESPHNFNNICDQKYSRLLTNNMNLSQMLHIDNNQCRKIDNKLDWTRDSDHFQYKQSGRACKGKRYLEFMAHGGLVVSKRQRRDPDNKMFNTSDIQHKHYNEFSNSTCNWKTYEENMKENNIKPMKSIWNEDIQHSPIFDKTDVPKSAYNNNNSNTSDISDTGQQTYFSDENSPEKSRDKFETVENKIFKASDFDLDAKIKALPSLSLEKFQQKKRENKKRRKTISSSKHKDIKPKKPHNISTNSKITTYISNSSREKIFTQKYDFDSGVHPDERLMPKPNEISPTYLTLDDKSKLAQEHKSSIVGSQKRKVRKTSITRLNVNSPMKIQENRFNIETAKNICTNIENALFKTTSKLSTLSQNSEDICGLATLAEVAANLQY